MTVPNKAIILCLMEKADEALVCSNKAIALKPSDASAYYNKGVILDELGRTKEASECYNKAKIDRNRL